MAGEFIIHRNNLIERNRWLEAHAAAVAPYLRERRDCRVFTFSRREPTDRATTRIGGLPHWPREAAWPTCQACGRPLNFAAQLDFRDLRDRPAVPGDVLTFHQCFACFPWRADDRGGALLSWHRHLPAEFLVTAADVPPVSIDC